MNPILFINFIIPYCSSVHIPSLSIHPYHPYWCSICMLPQPTTQYHVYCHIVIDICDLSHRFSIIQTHTRWHSHHLNTFNTHPLFLFPFLQPAMGRPMDLKDLDLELSTPLPKLCLRTASASVVELCIIYEQHLYLITVIYTDILWYVETCAFTVKNIYTSQLAPTKWSFCFVKFNTMH